MSLKETPEQRDKRLATERQARKLAELLKGSMPPGIGFTLFLFTVGEKPGEGNHLAYISMADRADMIKTIKEWLARVEHTS